MAQKRIVRFPLINFHLVPLKDITIKLTSDETIAILDKDKMEIKYPSRTYYLLEIKGGSYARLLHRAMLVMNALRLFQDGFIGFDEPYWGNEIPVFTAAEIVLIQDLEDITKIVDFFPDYSLDQEQISDFQRFFSRIDYAILDGNLKVALRHFNEAIVARFRYDRLVKYVMTLDSLFTYRSLATKVAFLLGKNESTQVDIFDVARHAWKLRNRIVHGNDLNVPTTFQMSELWNITRKALRAAIALKQDACYKGKGGRNQLLDDLDKCVFDSQLNSSIQEKVKKFYSD